MSSHLSAPHAPSKSCQTQSATTSMAFPPPPQHNAFIAAQPKGLAKLGFNLLHAVFNKLQQGTMVCSLPNGETHVYGEPLHKDAATLNSSPSAGLPLQAHLNVHHWDFFKKILLQGHVGLAESYMDGDWDSPVVEDVLSWGLLNQEGLTFLEGSPSASLLFNPLRWWNKLSHALRSNTLANSVKNIQEHYDLGNAFFEEFLDPTLTYSSGYYQHPEQDLEQAQRAKYERLCRLLRLKACDHVLEIGSGWGGFACYAAQTYGCKVTTLTLSQQQHDYVEKKAKTLGLQNKVKVFLKDYRAMVGQFDKIVSIEMIEAVGDAFYETYFAQCGHLLKPEGLLALQMITCSDARYDTLKHNVDFIQKHIFPGSLLPSLARLHEATLRSGSGLVLHDLKDMTNSYVRTLEAWHQRFQLKRSVIAKQGYSERFLRKWSYYLMYCKAAFRMRQISVVQVLYSRSNNLCLVDYDLLPEAASTSG